MECRIVEIDDNEKKQLQDRIRGSLIGGAAGDALGYAVEFDREKEIFDRYGKDGITEYELTDGRAMISDDTQMTLFTACGLLGAVTRNALRGGSGLPRYDIAGAYIDWYRTQTCSFHTIKALLPTAADGRHSWLLDIPELFARRAPGGTCLQALSGNPKLHEDYIKAHLNDSKGCGGIMRIAPVALFYRAGINFCADIRKVDYEAAQAAAITHGHPLGYMSSAAAAHIINRVLTDGQTESLRNIVIEAMDAMEELFDGDPYLETLIRIMELALALSENGDDDLANIHKLGEGWVAEETLGIAIYCALKYQNDFSKAMIVSVNHKGDSDSTGAVTGNILGALIGYDAIDEKWKKNLELHDVILEVADDLSAAAAAGGEDIFRDPRWIRKYVEFVNGSFSRR